MDAETEEQLNRVYDQMYRSGETSNYAKRHGISSQPILTVTSDEIAYDITEILSPRIEGKTVIEIGGGIGLLAVHMGRVAKRVYCIEANPMWTNIFTAMLMRSKPKNVSYLFGAADEFAGTIKGDVAVFCTHSGVKSMKAAGSLFAPVVVDVYGEIIAEDPSSHPLVARVLRRWV